MKISRAISTQFELYVPVKLVHGVRCSFMSTNHVRSGLTERGDRAPGTRLVIIVHKKPKKKNKKTTTTLRIRTSISSNVFNDLLGLSTFSKAAQVRAITSRRPS